MMSLGFFALHRPPPRPEGQPSWKSVPFIMRRNGQNQSKKARLSYLRYGARMRRMTTGKPMGLVSPQTSRQRIETFLRQNDGHRYCDECIATTTGVRNPAQVSSKVQSLVRMSAGFIRMRMRCTSCGQLRKTTWYVANYWVL